MKQLDHLLRLLKLQSRFEKVKGFSSVLRLGYEDIAAEPQRISFAKGKKNEIRVKVKVDESFLLHGQQTLGLSTYMALIDDVTTWALMCANMDRPRPGVSLNLRGNWISPTHIVKNNEIDIVAEVTKIGKNIGFVDAIVLDEQDQMVFQGSHIKYLASLGLAGEILTSPYGRSLADMYVNQIASAAKGTPATMKEMFSGIEYETVTKANFAASREHASLGAPIHGGCQGILMEQAAQHYAQSIFKGGETVLQSLNIDFLSSTSSKVELVVDEIARTGNTCVLQVKLNSRGRLVSQATANIVNYESKSKL